MYNHAQQGHQVKKNVMLLSHIGVWTKRVPGILKVPNMLEIISQEYVANSQLKCRVRLE